MSVCIVLAPSIENLIIIVVPFRETIVEPPDTDMVNEEMNEENKIVNTSDNQVSSN